MTSSKHFVNITNATGQIINETDNNGIAKTYQFFFTFAGAFSVRKRTAKITDMPSIQRSFYLLNTRINCLIFSIIEWSELMPLVFYYKDMLEKVNLADSCKNGNQRINSLKVMMNQAQALEDLKRNHFTYKRPPIRTCRFKVYANSVGCL